MNNMKEVIEKLKEKGKTIATMESCTGGGLAYTITNVEGASDVFQYGAVTYSNEAKISQGVDPKIIEEYTVYSEEVAKDMSKKISLLANSDYGVGITGKLNRPDKNNPNGNDNQVFFSIYDKEKDEYYVTNLFVDRPTRELNKLLIIENIEKELLTILNQNVYIRK